MADDVAGAPKWAAVTQLRVAGAAARWLALLPHRRHAQQRAHPARGRLQDAGGPRAEERDGDRQLSARLTPAMLEPTCASTSSTQTARRAWPRCRPTPRGASAPFSTFAGRRLWRPIARSGSARAPHRQRLLPRPRQGLGRERGHERRHPLGLRHALTQPPAAAAGARFSAGAPPAAAPAPRCPPARVAARGRPVRRRRRPRTWCRAACHCLQRDVLRRVVGLDRDERVARAPYFDAVRASTTATTMTEGALPIQPWPLHPGHRVDGRVGLLSKYSGRTPLLPANGWFR